MRARAGLSRLFRILRHRLLCGLGGSIMSYVLSCIALGQAVATPLVFDEIPPSRSGIQWTHTAARSAQKYLPEATGPGCAFLDYDNDGWVDIYLVNSGQSEFFTPAQPLRNALYHNN